MPVQAEPSRIVPGIWLCAGGVEAAVWEGSEVVWGSAWLGGWAGAADQGPSSPSGCEGKPSA